MARDWKTTYSASVSSADHTVTFPEPALSGRKLVAFGSAPANIGLPAGWIEHAYNLSATSGSIAGSKAAVGGETSLTFTRRPSENTLPRTFAGWVESRDDLGALHGSPVVVSQASVTAGTIALPAITTTVGGCRVYVTLAQALPGSAWTPTWPTELTGEDVFTAPGLSNEAQRFAVASGVLESAGSHSLTISGLPSGTYQVLAVAFETLEGGTPPPAAETAVEAENRLPGVAKATWDIAGAGDASIQGFATAMSVARGGTLSLKVHSPSSAWTGKVYRLGFYAGLGAREVGTVSGALTTQPSGTTDATTGMVSCANWTANGSWAVPADATPGVYIIKVERTDNAALASHIGPFVVTDPSRKAAIAVKLSDATWQAYNHFGANPADPFNGKSLYGPGTATEFTFHQPSRCKAVSYDRPFVTRRHLPQTWFFNAEYPMLRWLERLGYDVDYLTCAQVDADPTLLLDRAVVFSSGHDEYWSQGMWDAFTGARDHATTPSHLAFFSGNEAFWRIRWASGRRSYECWKDTHDGALNATGLYSGTWQDTRSFNQLRRPPALLTGTRFRLNGISAFPLVATADHASSPLWRDTEVAALTGAQTWQSPNHIVGFEADEPADTSASEKPAGLIRLAEGSRTVNGMLSDDNGDNYAQSGTFTHALTAYRSPTTGAVVFGAGTVQFSWALDDTHDRYSGFSGVTPVLQQALANLLADLGALPPAYPFPSGLVMPTPVALSTYGLPDPEPDPDPEPAGELVTMTQFTDYLKAVNPQLAARVTGDLAGAAELELAAAIGGVVDFCGWHLAPQRTDTVTVDGSGSPIQALPTLRLVDLVSVTEDGTAVDLTDVQWSEAGYLWRSAPWTRKLRGVVADIEHGFAETPAAVVAIVCAAAARALTIVPGVARESSGGESISYNPGEGVPLTEQEERILARRYQIANPA